jgi:Uma2 family endonuclease
MPITPNDPIYAESATNRRMDDATIFTMDAKGATLEDLEQVEGKAELVGGTIVRMTPAGYRHIRASARILESLLAYERQSPRGCAVGDSGGFRVQLAHRQSFSPDAAYYLGPPTGEDFLDGAPVFAVEIRSKKGYAPAAESRLAAKRADYFAAGTVVVWDVDLRAGVVRVYRARGPESPVLYQRGEVAEAEPALPGWSMPVDDLFPPER